MWADNETSRDFLNFSGVADTVAEIIVQAHGRPISIGVSGAWGIGKSSLIKLTQASLASRPKEEDQRDFVFVEFNAWLYQGYDDARAALMDVIASKLQAEAEHRATAVDNIRTAEMTEAYFARVVAVVEGATEREALPIYARALGLDFDQAGVSIVGAGSKSAIDTLVQLYEAHAIRRYIIFDNDVENDQEKTTNRTLCRLLAQPEADVPPAQIHNDFAIVDGNWEKQFQAELDAMEVGLYAKLEGDARAALGIAPRRNKPLVARFIAENLIERGMTPPFVRSIVEKIAAKAAAA